MENALNSHLHSLTWLVFAMLALSACSSASDSSVSSDAVPLVPEQAAEVIEPGLIADPQFEVVGDNLPLRHWRLFQHAGDASFSMDVGAGEVRLRRFGVEPWGTIEQTHSVDSLVGKTLEWSAELSGELGESRGEPFDSSGLSVSVMGFGPNDLMMMGARHLLTLSSDPPLSTGPVERRRYSIRFVVPEGSELELKVALQLTRDGELRMRAPSLRVIEESAAP